MRSGSASRSPESSPQGDVTGPDATVPMPGRQVDDKPSATLVVVFGRRFWTGSSTLPHLHQLAHRARPRHDRRGRSRFPGHAARSPSQPSVPGTRLRRASSRRNSPSSSTSPARTRRSPLGIQARRSNGTARAKGTARPPSGSPPRSPAPPGRQREPLDPRRRWSRGPLPLRVHGFHQSESHATADGVVLCSWAERPQPC